MNKKRENQFHIVMVSPDDEGAEVTFFILPPGQVTMGTIYGDGGEPGSFGKIRIYTSDPDCPEARELLAELLDDRERLMGGARLTPEGIDVVIIADVAKPAK